MRKTPARAAGVVLALLGTMLLPGCGALKRAPVEKRYFVLEAARSESAAPAEDGAIVYLKTLKVSPLTSSTGAARAMRNAREISSTWISGRHCSPL